MIIWFDSPVQLLLLCCDGPSLKGIGELLQLSSSVVAQLIGPYNMALEAWSFWSREAYTPPRPVSHQPRIIVVWLLTVINWIVDSWCSVHCLLCDLLFLFQIQMVNSSRQVIWRLKLKQSGPGLGLRRLGGLRVSHCCPEPVQGPFSLVLHVSGRGVESVQSPETRG